MHLLTAASVCFAYVDEVSSATYYVLVLVVEVETVKLSLICAVVTETNTVQ